MLVAERPPEYLGRSRGEIPEKLLARLWRQRAARQEGFRTAAGLLIRVVYPGRESGVGPDFQDAILDVEGQGLVRGDVELHVRQRDWHSHGHSGDPNYNGVVLHAALEVEAESTSTGLHSGGNAPVVSLASLLVEASDDAASPEAAAGADEQDGVAGNLWSLLEPLGYSRPASKEQAGELLDRAGDQRFEGKVREFATLLNETERAGDSGDQVLYEGLMEGLGYKANRQGFLSLAHRTPWSRLVELTSGMDEEQGWLALRGWMSQVSGLERKLTTADADQKLPSGVGPPLAPGDWRLSGLRPVNHPLRRIAGAAGLVLQFREVGLTAGLQAICDADDPRKLTKALMKPSKDGLSGAAYIGQDRARDLAVNVVLPFLQAAGLRAADQRAGQGGDQPAGTAGPQALYHAFGKLQDNEVTREIARLLLPSPWRSAANSARRQQGLIRLHRILAGAS